MITIRNCRSSRLWGFSADIGASGRSLARLCVLKRQVVAALMGEGSITALRQSQPLLFANEPSSCEFFLKLLQLSKSHCGLILEVSVIYFPDCSKAYTMFEATYLETHMK